ncbi:MAG: ABC transporter ATP-binding protein [Candidatus Eiseniibacteriota bacterium]|jgi:ABC-2 type transport system ATP-binding protein
MPTRPPIPHPTSEVTLAVSGLHKSYGDNRAVAGIDLAVHRGEIVGLIGPDGAGKTTTMRMVLGLVRPDAGTVRILGEDAVTRPRALKDRLGYMPQRFSLYPDLTVAENLRFFADLYLVPPAERDRREDELLAFSHLDAFRDRRAGALSGGMKQKLALSCNLVHTPELLVLDEPTTGVDPVSRQEFWTHLKQLADDGMALLVSTPYMDEAERCHRVLLVHGGRVVARGTPAELTRAYPNRLLEIRTDHVAAVARQLRELDLPGLEVLRFGDSLHVVHDAAQAEALNSALADRGLIATGIAPSIEDVFVALAGTAGREMP